ncbi:Eukaryotic translation initiation factor 3 subunit J [Dinochytrium kinnereticum]|nr:Eukaryotic translation initiation factor 3 subunit J [Dinochytrium kinnereticum]
MGDWEDEDEEVSVTVPIVNPSTWEGEDAEEVDVKDSWDASEDEDESKPKEKAADNASPKPTKPKKKKLAQKIAERKAKETEKEADPFEGETMEQRKQREEKSIRDSDFENAKDLFGVTNVPVSDAASFLDTMRPSTKAEFDDFTSKLTQKLSSQEKSSHFGYFVENLCRDLCVSLSVEDVKRISSSLTALANEKAKAAKPAVGKKKAPAKKAILKTGPSGADTTNYDDVYDDFDDFM